MKARINSDGFFKGEEYFFPIGVNYWPRDMAVYLWKE